ncbi:PQQ-dependent sugar dehydrogenase [Alphaproteobacteria bacterium]|nr:PQQ-dependent sugar dehydrogenase [Alphaproteobacteria bacterium]|tara:strand:+ start:814 stop:1887 length:1074 start_codon:yes stop_codon:yes gene_type:complete
MINLFIILMILFFPLTTYSKTLLEKVSPDISFLWGIAALNKQEVLVTQKSGNVFRINVFTKNINKIYGTPKVFASGQGGLLDIAIEKNDKYLNVYLCLSKPIGNNKSSTAIYKYNLINDNLLNKKILFVSNSPSSVPGHFGCRLSINGKFIFATLGERQNRHNAQKFSNHSGSVIKILKNGKNFKNNNIKQKWLPELFTIGHRNPQGLAFNHISNQLWLHEHGPQGGDEINILLEGKNYGWPIVSYGEEYGGGKIGEGITKFGFEEPVWVWTPSIAPSGMIFYRGSMFDEFKNTILVGSLKFKRLHVIKVHENIPISEKIILENKIGRIRDIEEMHDGSIILINDELKGGVYRLYRQ